MQEEIDYKFPKVVLTNVVLLAVAFQMAAIAIGQNQAPRKTIAIKQEISRLRSEAFIPAPVPQPVETSKHADELKQIRSSHIIAEQKQIAAESFANVNAIRLSHQYANHIASKPPYTETTSTESAPPPSPDQTDANTTILDTEIVIGPNVISLIPKSKKRLPPAQKTAQTKKPAQLAPDASVNAQQIISAKGQQKIAKNLGKMKRELNGVFSASGYAKLKPYVEATHKITGFPILDSWTLAFYESRVAQKVQYNFLTFYPDPFFDQMTWYGAELAEQIAKSGVGTINGKNYKDVSKQLAGLMKDYERLSDKKNRSLAETTLLSRTKQALMGYYKDPLMLLCLTAKHLQSTEAALNSSCPNKNLLREIGPGMYRLGHLFGKEGAKNYITRAGNGSKVGGSISHPDIRHYYSIENVDPVIDALLKITKEYNDLRSEIASNLKIPDDRKPSVATNNSPAPSSLVETSGPSTALLNEPSGSQARTNALRYVQMANNKHATENHVVK